VKVGGKRPAQIGAEIAFRLRDGQFLRSPQVSIFVKEYNSKTIQVLGQVQKPGRFPYYDNMSAVEALSLAGGFTPLAWRDRTTLTRTRTASRPRRRSSSATWSRARAQRGAQARRPPQRPRAAVLALPGRSAGGTMVTMAVRPRSWPRRCCGGTARRFAEYARRAAELRAALGPELRAALGARAGCRAWLIGSLAHGTFGAASDVDLVVAGLEPEAAASLGLALADRLAARVDLLRLEELRPSFRDRVLAEGMPIDVT